MFRKFNIFLFILLFSSIFCLTNTFADENGEPPEIIGFEFPVPNELPNIPGFPDAQITPEFIIGSPDFEKMRDLPKDSQDYQLGRKVGWLITPVVGNPGYFWICTGFLVGPDLFMTNHHCLHHRDTGEQHPIESFRLYMNYYQEPDVDPTRGGLTARVSAILKMDEEKDYALLRLDKRIGDTYGWLELDPSNRPNSSESVKLISHPDGRSKEIVRRNSQILDLPPDIPDDFPYFFYLADTQGGSSGSPVFLRDGTGVIGIHHHGYVDAQGEPRFNIGTLMKYIVPEIEQYLPGDIADPEPDLIVEAPIVSNNYVLSGASFTLSATVRNIGDADSTATLARFYQNPDDPNAIEVGTADVPPLLIGEERNDTFKVSITLNAPLTLGIHDYSVCVDPIDNENHRDNNCSPPVALTVSDVLPIHMYWLDSGTDSIQRAYVDGSNVQDIVTTGLRTPTSIAVDAKTLKVYWTDSGTDTIQRVDFHGSNIEDIVTRGLRTPTSIAVDTFSGNIYWTDSGTDKIQRVDFDGYIEDLVTTGLRTPTSIAIDAYDPDLGKMYWTDSGTDKIQRANLNGSNVQDLVTDGLRTPTSIALDLVNGKMYWTDSGTDKIQRANLDGSNIEDIVTTGLRTPTGIELDPDEGKVYWTDSGTDKIQRANLDGSNIEDLVTTGLRTPTDIALDIPQIVSSEPPPEPPPEPPGPGPGPDPGSVDVNGDGQVTVIDLAIIALHYGIQVPAGVALPADVNDDGTVDISDLVAVAAAIDAEGNADTLSIEDVEVVSEAIEVAAAKAPAHFSTSQHAQLSGIAYQNVAAAFEAAKHLATEDVHLGKWMPLLKELLHLLTEMRGIPDTTALLPNYPNPFNPETWIPYHLAQDAEVTLTIHDVRGVLVQALTLGHQVAGVYESRARAAYWDGRNQSGEPVASGLYFYTLTADDFTATRKLLIIK